MFFELFEQHASVICQASELFATGVESGRGQVFTISRQIKALEERGDEILQQNCRAATEDISNPI